MSIRGIFVFGSNLSGIHGAGAALYARENFGAELGVGEGLTGDAYALPTKGKRKKDKTFDILPLEEIETHIITFLKHARKNPSNIYLVTPIGTGLAGYSKKQIMNLFRRHKNKIWINVVFTKEWFL